MTSWLAGFAAPVGQADCFACLYYSCAAGTTRHVRGALVLVLFTVQNTFWHGARRNLGSSRSDSSSVEIAQRQKNRGGERKTTIADRKGAIKSDFPALFSRARARENEKATRGTVSTRPGRHVHVQVPAPTERTTNETGPNSNPRTG